MSTPEAVRRVLTAFPEFRLKTVQRSGTVTTWGLRRAGEPQDDGRFRIVHTGYLHTDLGLRYRSWAEYGDLLGGHVRGVDVLPRSHVFLLEAVDRLLVEGPELRGRIEISSRGCSRAGSSGRGSIFIRGQPGVREPSGGGRVDTDG